MLDERPGDNPLAPPAENNNSAASSSLTIARRHSVPSRSPHNPQELVPKIDTRVDTPVLVRLTCQLKSDDKFWSNDADHYDRIP